MPSFYRVVMTDPPTRVDFESHVVRGLPHDRSTPRAQRMALGVSVNATLAQARTRARYLRLPFIAEVSVPESGAIAFERTGTQRGHHTLWGDAAALLAAVVRLIPVDEVD